MSFVNLSIVKRCSLPHESFRLANQTCDLAKSTFSCGSFVHLINYLEIFFCEFNLHKMVAYGVISAVILVIQFSLLFMVTKYFFVPNLVTLIEFAPLTMFGFSFLFFGPSFFVSYYNSFCGVCYFPKFNMSPLHFSKMVGDIMRYFVMGVMVICMQGYRADGVTLWSCMTFILIGLGYLFVVTKKSYHIDPDPGRVVRYISTKCPESKPKIKLILGYG
uniref:Uncharacterized protein LOC108037267 n=1 Tax=Drosophila rhopaloa TaxID=1041015 RepID=A0A6P4DV60_DRORH